MIKRLLKVILSLAYYVAAVVPRRLLRALGITRHGDVIVLAYHGVAANEAGRFARQMDMSLRAGRSVALWRGEEWGGPDRKFAVTFDDAFADLIQNALPALAARGIPATIFVPSGNLDAPPRWKMSAPFSYAGERIMSACELCALDSALVEIGSHSATHADLSLLDAAAAAGELAGSKAALEAAAGKAISSIAFPHGAFTDETLGLARAAGYARAWSIEPDPAVADRFLNGRVRIDPTDWPVEAWLKIHGGLGWMAFLHRRRAVGSAPAAALGREACCG